MLSMTSSAASALDTIENNTVCLKASWSAFFRTRPRTAG